MKSEEKPKLLMDTEKYKKLGGEIREILSTCVDILITEGFTDDEINVFFKHCHIGERIKSLSKDEKIDYILNCDSFWEYYEDKAEYEKYSREEILKKRRKYTEKYVKDVENRNRKRMCDIHFSNLQN